MDGYLEKLFFWKRKFIISDIDFTLSEIGNVYFVFSPRTLELEHIVSTLCFAYLKEFEASGRCVAHPIFIPIFCFPQADLTSNYIIKNILHLILIEPEKFIYLDSLPRKFIEGIYTEPGHICVYNVRFDEISLRLINLKNDSFLKFDSKEYSNYFLFLCNMIYVQPSFQDSIVIKLIIATLSQLILSHQETQCEPTRICLTKFSSLLPNFNCDHLLIWAPGIATDILISSGMSRLNFHTIKLCICCISSQNVNTLLCRPDAINCIHELLTLECADVYLGVTSLIQNYQAKRQLFLVARTFQDLDDILIWPLLIQILCNSTELGLETYEIDHREMNNSDKVTIQVCYLLKLCVVYLPNYTYRNISVSKLGNGTIPGNFCT